MLSITRGKLEAEKMNFKSFSYGRTVKVTYNFSQACMVGKGAFDNIYRGTSVRRAKDMFKTKILEITEVKLLSKVKHENLVGLVGFCEGNVTILVYEYVINGSVPDYIIGKIDRLLLKHFQQKPKKNTNNKNKIRYGFEAKVSDFGLVRSGPDGDKSHVTSQ
ncbi:hypothetical protein MIMGU_mgv1a021906mg, partial [Erythranthe guttata]